MAGSLGRLVVDLLLKTGSFESDMGRASKTAKKRMKEIEQSANKAGKVLGTALAAGVGLAAVAIKQAIDQADQLNEISQKIGIPTDVLSGLNYAAKLSGIATEELQSGLVKMVKTQADAAQGGKESSKVFKTLGIDIKDAAGNLRGTDAVFADFAEVFSRLPDGPEKTALALKVFGKAGAELIPLLNEGKAGIKGYADELQQLGGTVTPATAAAADEFNDNLDKLKVAFGGLALKVAEELLPRLIVLTDEFVEFSKNGDNAASIANNIAGAFSAVAGFASKAALGVQTLKNVYQAFKESAQGSVFGDSPSTIYDRLTKEQAERGKFDAPGATSGRRSGTNGTNNRVRASGGSAPDISGLFSPDAKTGGAKKQRANVDEVAQAYGRMNAQMAETIALFGQTSEVAKLRYDLEHGELAKLSDAKKQELLAQAAQIDVLNEEKTAKEELNRLDEDRIQAAKQHAKAIKDLLEDIAFETELTKLSNDEKEKAIALRNAGALATTAEGQAILASIDSLQKARKSNGELTASMDEFRQTFSDNVTDVLTGAKSIGDAFKSLADSVVAQIARIIANQLTAKLFGDPGSAGAGTQGGGIVSSLFKAFLPGFATGTNFAPGGYAVVGEKGPEIVNLPRGSQVIPNHMVGRGGRGVTNNFIVPKGTDRQTQSYIAAKTARAARVAARDS